MQEKKPEEDGNIAGVDVESAEQSLCCSDCRRELVLGKLVHGRCWSCHVRGISFGFVPGGNRRENRLLEPEGEQFKRLG